MNSRTSFTGEGGSHQSRAVSEASRDVAGIALETSQLENGLIFIRWKILERNDGGVIQLTYERDEGVPILGDAIIEGQADLS